MTDATTLLREARRELGRFPALLDGIVAGLSPAQWRARPAPTSGPPSRSCAISATRRPRTSAPGSASFSRAAPGSRPSIRKAGRGPGTTGRRIPPRRSPRSGRTGRRAWPSSPRPARSVSPASGESPSGLRLSGLDVLAAWVAARRAPPPPARGHADAGMGGPLGAAPGGLRRTDPVPARRIWRGGLAPPAAPSPAVPRRGLAASGGLLDWPPEGVRRRPPRSAAPRRHPTSDKEDPMGQMLTLTAEDGHRLSAYRATPTGKPRGGLVVVQEIFGVNHHIKRSPTASPPTATWRSRPRSSTASSAASSIGYTADDIERGRMLRGKLAIEDSVRDVRGRGGGAAARPAQGRRGRLLLGRHPGLARRARASTACRPARRLLRRRHRRDRRASRRAAR